MSATQAYYRWPFAALVLGIVLATLCFLYRSTLLSMVQVWNESDTFSHGYLVFPAVAFLIYRGRDRLAAIQPHPSAVGLVLLLLCLALWFVAHVGAVQVAEQFALVGAMVASFWTVLGGRAVRAVLFALLFVFFAVPFGDFIIPSLMRFTAWFVVKGIELSGIPVYRDGFLLSIPGGDFEVAKACSGIRYLIASVSLGSFFAYLTFHSLRRRLIFVAAAIVLPIIANGLRAYGIVMIAHLSNMQYAVGVDHLIYGWLFFGVLMFAMFFVGGRFAEDAPENVAPTGAERGTGVTVSRLVVPALALVAIVTVPALAQRALSAGGATIDAASLPRPADGWRRVAAASRDYVPRFNDADDLKRASYQSGLGNVGVTVHSYTDRDVELIRAGNIFIATQGHKIIRNVPEALPVGDQTWTVGHIDMLEFSPRRMILYWYQVGERRTISPNAAKIYEWLARLRGQATRRALVTLSTPMSQGDGVPPVLREFLRLHGQSLATCVSSPDAVDCATTEPGT